MLTPMKTSLRSALRVLVVLTGVVVAGCQTTAPEAASSASPAATTPRSVLRVGVTPDLPPMVFKQGGQLMGLEIDLARQLGASLGREVKFVEVDWDKQIDALLEGRTDVIMSGMSITAARATRVDFAQPYLRAGQNVLVLRSEATRVQLLLGAQKMKVGVQKGTTSDYFLQQNLPKAERVIVRSPESAVKMLIDKKIEAFVSDATVNWWLAAEHEAQGITVLPNLLTEELLAWGFRKQDIQLRNDASSFVEKSRQDGSLEKIARRWLPFAQ
jgi:polar amino acid transport system substrate-binding protein